MNTPEVEDEVRRELDENPALEEVASPDSVPEENGTDTDDFNETADELQLADYGHDDDIPSYRLSANNNSPDDTTKHSAQATMKIPLSKPWTNGWPNSTLTKPNGK
jgi:RNA polymerase sigma-54 factor